MSQKPLILTSLPFKWEKEAAYSWHTMGADVVSLVDDDVSSCIDSKIKFVYAPSKPKDKRKIKIRKILNYGAATEYEVLGLFNSDIIIKNNPESKALWDKCVEVAGKGGFVYISRFDVDDGKMHQWGLDCFFFNRSFAENIASKTPAGFCLGKCMWPKWLSYQAYKQGLPLYWVKRPFAFHREHSRTYNGQDCAAAFQDFRLVDPEFRRADVMEITRKLHRRYTSVSTIL